MNIAIVGTGYVGLVTGVCFAEFGVHVTCKKDGSANLCYIDDVARTVAQTLDGYKVIVTKSTVPVGTGRRIQKIIREGIGNGPQGVFDVASNPEFLREGSAIEDFLRPNRVVIGADSPQAIAILQDLYRPLYLIETPFVITSIKAAELIATKISFMNELANLCELPGVVS